MTSDASRPYDLLNRWFTRLAFAAAPALGSAASLLINGAGLWAVEAVVFGKAALRRDRAMITLTVPIYAFCALYVFAFIVTGGGLDETLYLAPLLTLLLFPFVYSSLAVTDRSTIASAAIAGAAVACFSASLFACYQVAFTTGRAEGLGGNPLVFAQVACMAALVTLAGTFLASRKLLPLLIAAYFAGAVAVVLSGSRIFWVALAAGTVVVLLGNRQAVGSTFSRRGMIISGAVALAIALASAGIVADRVNALWNDWSQARQPNQESSLGIRLGMWRIGAQLLQENPLFGVGPQNSAREIDLGLQRDMGIDFSYTHFHNGFLTASVEAGVLGGASLCAIFIAALLVAMRGSRGATGPERFGRSMLSATVTVYLIGGMTGILFGHDILDAVLVLHLATGAYLARTTERARDL